MSAEPRLTALLSDAGFGDCPQHRLPAEIETPIRRLIESAAPAPDVRIEGAFTVARLLIRCSVLYGPDDYCIAASIEALRSRDPIGAGARRFDLTRREVEVMSRLLAGMKARQIAAELCIAESTVADHIKSIYAKTDVRSRAAMAARIFDWNGLLD